MVWPPVDESDSDSATQPLATDDTDSKEQDDDTGDEELTTDLYEAAMTPISGTGDNSDKLQLKGRTENFVWDLMVEQEWPGLSWSSIIFKPAHGDDIGNNPIVSVLGNEEC